MGLSMGLFKFKCVITTDIATRSVNSNLIGEIVTRQALAWPKAQ